MDGAYANPSMNLHREWMNSSNIVDLFRKHNVPLTFDHMTVDIDLNTFWVLQVRRSLTTLN